MTKPRRQQRALRKCLLLTLLCGYVAATMAEGEERPWGRLDKPNGAVAPSRQVMGYRGHYNPWTVSAGQPSTTGRYRDAMNSEGRYRYRQRPGQRWPSLPTRDDGMQMGGPYGTYLGYPGYYGQGLGLSPFAWSAPIGTFGPSPYYGNYWNDPFTSAQPGYGWPMDGGYR